LAAAEEVASAYAGRAGFAALAASSDAAEDEDAFSDEAEQGEEGEGDGKKLPRWFRELNVAGFEPDLAFYRNFIQGVGLGTP